MFWLLNCAGPMKTPASPRKTPDSNTADRCSLVLAVADLAGDKSGGGSDDRCQSLAIEVVRQWFARSPKSRQRESVIKCRLNASEFQKTRVDVARVEIGDLAGGIAGERAAGRCIGKVGES